MLPRAVKRVTSRVVLYSLGAIFILTLNLSSNDPILSASLQDPSVAYGGPFTLLTRRAGLEGFAKAINIFTVIALASVSPAQVYVAVRICLLLRLISESNDFCSIQTGTWSSNPSLAR